MARSDHSDRDKAERIKRLRERVQNIADPAVRAVFMGLLDLLADEL
jgi:hypothetical protein